MASYHSGRGDNVAGNKYVTLRIPLSVFIGILLTCGVAFGVYYYFFRDNIAPFRVTYFDIEGAAIDLLSEGQLEDEWEEFLSKETFIINNNVLEYLRNLRKKYNEESEEYGIYFTNSRANEKETNNLNLQYRKIGNRNPRESQFIEENKVLVATQYHEFLSTQIDYESVLKIFPPTDDCHSLIKSKRRLLESDTLFKCHKYATLSDYNIIKKNKSPLIQNSITGFFSEVTKNNFPQKLMKLKMTACCHNIEGGCQEGEYYGEYPLPINKYNVSIEFPIIKLRVFVIENTTTKPIRIDAVNKIELNDRFLRYLPYNNSLLDTLDRNHIIDGEDFFPAKILKPSEKILVPTYLYLETSSKIKYVFGSSFYLRDIYINKTAFSFRQEKLENFGVFFNGCECGSCPYVYTKDEQNGSWNFERPFIKDNVGELQDRLDTIELSQLSKKLLIEEREFEISFIDYIELIVVDDNGESTSYYHEVDKLKEIDGVYIELKRGDRFELEFFIPHAQINFNPKKVLLVSKGYYIPIKEKLDTT